MPYDSAPRFGMPFSAEQEMLAELHDREHSPLTDFGGNAWERISKGQTLGKRCVVPYVNLGAAFNTPVGSPVDLFTVRSKNGDLDALQFCLQISAPRFFPKGTIALPNIQDMSGSMDNIDQMVLPVARQLSLANPVLTVHWGVGGVDNRAEVDVLNGLSLNLSASFVRASMSVENPPAGGPDTGFYELHAHIGPGIPKGRNAQRTIQFTTIPAEASGPVTPTPRFAKTVYLTGQNVAFDLFSANLRFWRDPAGTQRVGSDLFFSANNPFPFPIPNGAYYFTVISHFAQQNTINAIFDLSI